MQDPKSVITTAAKGLVRDLAEEFEVSESRMYEILSKDNPYPRTKRLIRAIGRVNPEGARAIKADLDAMFSQILNEVEPVDLAAFHKETTEAFHAMLAGEPRDVQLKELREAGAKIEAAIEAIAAGGRIN